MRRNYSSRIIEHLRIHGASTLAELPGHPSRSEVLDVPHVVEIKSDPPRFYLDEGPRPARSSRFGGPIGSSIGGPIGSGAVGSSPGTGRRSSFGGPIGRRRP